MDIDWKEVERTIEDRLIEKNPGLSELSTGAFEYLDDRVARLRQRCL
jgi:hypothetical protein